MQRSNADVVQVQVKAATTRLGLELEPAAYVRLAQLVGLWQRFGRAFNLSSASDEAELLKHVVEGLQVVALAHKLGWHPGQTWLDVGSGAGFPGLVVAACLDVTVTLAEPRERRAAFLDLAVHQIGRADCGVSRGHVDGASWRPVKKVGAGLKAHGFDWASARAVFAPSVWVDVGQQWVRPGGVVVAHVRVDSAAFDGEAGRVDGEHWSIRGIRRL